MVKKEIQALMSEAMEKYGKLALATGNKEKMLSQGTETDSIQMPGISMLRLREAFLKLGDVLDEDENNKTIVAVVPTGAMQATRALSVARLDSDCVDIAVYCKEGLFKQHGAKRVIENLKKELSR